MLWILAWPGHQQQWCILRMINMPGPSMRQWHISQWWWWCHQMGTFSALPAFCAGKSPVPGEFPAQRPVTWSFDTSFDLRVNRRLSKQSWGWWFQTPSRPLWRHCNVQKYINSSITCILWKYTIPEMPLTQEIILMSCGLYRWRSNCMRNAGCIHCDYWGLIVLGLLDKTEWAGWARQMIRTTLYNRKYRIDQFICHKSTLDDLK